MKVLIVYGPTQEPIDPVRFISNQSTGTMGRLLVEAARHGGHEITAVECPKDARTARDLQSILGKLLPKHDVLIMAAAVCDARPEKVSRAKIKKENLKTIRLVKNPDILAGLAKRKKKGQIFIGFGIESEDVIENGFKKLKSKNLDMIVMQEISAKKSPFGDKAVDAMVLEKDGRIQKFKSVSKKKLAGKLLDMAIRRVTRVRHKALSDPS